MNTATQKGIIPGANAAPFIAVIVTVPVVQILTIILASCTLTIEIAPPFVKKWPVYRSLVIRIVLLLVQTFLGILFYQGTNGALWSCIAAIGYIAGQMKGEMIEEAKENRGRAGAA